MVVKVQLLIDLVNRVIDNSVQLLIDLVNRVIDNRVIDNRRPVTYRPGQ
jgi:hypothetical protein